jgi:hypothetical protein
MRSRAEEEDLEERVRDIRFAIFGFVTGFRCTFVRIAQNERAMHKIRPILNKRIPPCERRGKVGCAASDEGRSRVGDVLSVLQTTTRKFIYINKLPDMLQINEIPLYFSCVVFIARVVM